MQNVLTPETVVDSDSIRVELNHRQATGISVVVPVYNSAASLEELTRRICKQLSNRQFELIFVNDGSRDSAWEVVAGLARTHPNVHAIDLMRNYGQHNALLCGIRAARYDTIVTMDDDLQHPPEEIDKLLQKLSEGYDVVYGKPQRENHSMGRVLASQITKLVLQDAMGADIARNISAFRAFRTKVRDAFANYQAPFVTIDVLLTWGSTKFGALAVQHDPRKIGGSNYTLKKLIMHAVTMMTGFSILPLRLASFTGFFFTIFGVCVLIYVVGRAVVFGTSVPGFPFLASVIALFSGAQLFALGIMGEYLARMHFRMMERPTYAVRTATSRS